MSKDLGEEEIAYIQNELDDENQKVHPPSKKKFEEELNKLIFMIREKEEALEQVKTAGSLDIASDLKNLKAERSATITRRKEIDVELDKLKKIIPEKMCQLGQLESSLIYKSEEKINAAIQRLEYNLNVQHFKLAEEKKIVSEIDRLKRSKKTLVQYLALKQETVGIRDLQRHMREERDNYFHVVGKLNSDENKLRKDSSASKTTYSLLKLQIDELYESRRQMVAHHKKQLEDYQSFKDKQRKGSWKKRDNYRKSNMADKRKQLIDVEKTQSEKHLIWCNSLIRVLSRYNNLSVQEPSLDSISPTSSLEEPELADEVNDGQYVLLKKSGESQDFPQGTRRSSKKNRRPRKQSSMKKITLSSDMVQQLAELGVEAPNSMLDVPGTIEILKLKKVLLEGEHFSEVTSDSGFSATESVFCEMSRQVSKTESYEGGVNTGPGDQVHVDLLHECQKGHSDLPEGWETRVATGGCLEVLGLKGDLDVKGDVGSCEGQISVSDLRTYEMRVPDVEGKETSIQSKENVRSKPGCHELSLEVTKDLQCAHIQRQTPAKQGTGETVTAGRDSLDLCRSESVKKSYSQQLVQNMQALNQWGKGKKPSLCISPVISPAVHHGISSTLSPEFPPLTPIALSPRMVLSPSNRSIPSPVTNDLLPVSSLPPSKSPTRPHQTLAERLSSPSSTTSAARQVQVYPSLPKQLSQPTLSFDCSEFPPLSQSRITSSLSTRSSSFSASLPSGSSSHHEQHLQLFD